MYNNIIVIGSSGAIGKALLNKLNQLYPEAKINAFTRSIPTNVYGNITFNQIDYANETSIADAAKIAIKCGQSDFIIVTTGVLHDEYVIPEKSFKDISYDKFQYLFAINTIFPALVAKHFLPNINKSKRAILAILSARVGSISDNCLGGWYSYRASKAALNMVVKNLGIEMKIRSKQTIIVGLHPGTVNSKLSKPFIENVPKDKLFTPEYSAEKLLSVINNLSIADSGKCFAWDGKEILP